MSLETETKDYALIIKEKKYKPAVVVGAEYNQTKVFDRSRPCDPSMRKSLRDKLRQLGNLYTIYNGNPIGNCAEVNVAQQIMENIDNVEIEQIIFSTPLRPRTQQPIDICDNCKHTFNK